jgi:hypothetical protein
MAVTRRQYLQLAGLQAGAWAMGWGARPARAQRLRSFNIEDFDARAAAAGDETPELAARNAAAINRAIREAHAAGGGTVVFPGVRYPVTAAAPARQGALARRGPVSQAISLDGCRNITLAPGGSRSRLVRLESEVTGHGWDASNSTLAINRSFDITVEGLEFEGQQSADVKNFTTGDAIQINFGSENIRISSVSITKGTTAIAVGSNMKEYGSHNRGIREPVRNITIESAEVLNCEHAVVVNIAQDVLIDGLRHRSSPYEFRNQAQPSYVQRGVYLLNCRKVTLRNAELLDASKVALFVALYPRRRAFSDVEDITVEKVTIGTRAAHLEDWEVGLQIFDQNEPRMERTTARRLNFSDITVTGMKTGLSLRRRNGEEVDSPSVRELGFSRFSAETTRAGVESGRNVGFAGLRFDKSSFKVAPRQGTGGRALVGLGLGTLGKGRSGFRSQDLALNEVEVRAACPAVTIGEVDRVRITRCYFEDSRAPDPQFPPVDLKLEGTTNVEQQELRQPSRDGARPR